MTDATVTDPPKPSEPAPKPEPSLPAINSAHVTAALAGGVSITDALSSVYDWILTWPIHSPTPEQCTSLAVLTVAFVGGGGFALLRKR